jgi:hypothetical protein
LPLTPAGRQAQSPTPENQPLEINGVRTPNLCPGLGKDTRDLRDLEAVDSGVIDLALTESGTEVGCPDPVDMKPKNVMELDEAWNHEHGLSPQEIRDDKDGDTEMNALVELHNVFGFHAQPFHTRADTRDLRDLEAVDSGVGPRMKWLRMKPKNVMELDEAWNHEHGLSPQEIRS